MLRKSFLYIIATISYGLLYANIQAQVLTEGVVNNRFQPCTIHEKELFIAIEYCDEYHIFTACNNGADLSINARAVEFDTTCWNIMQSYSKGLYLPCDFEWFYRSYCNIDHTVICDSIYRTNSQREKFNIASAMRVCSLFNNSYGKFTVIKDTAFENLYNKYFTSPIYEIRFIGHIYCIYKVHIKYRFLGYCQMQIQNFHMSNKNLWLFNILEVPCFEILDVLAMEPISPNITEDCLSP